MATHVDTQVGHRAHAVYRSSHTKQVRVQEQIAKGVLWFFAGLTVAVLVGIIGYIVVNGFYTREVDDGPAIGSDQTVIPLGDGLEMTVLRTRSLRLREVDYSALAEVVRGDQTFLGFLTLQNRNATVAIGGDAAFREAVADYFRAPLDALPPVMNLDQVERVLRENDGGIALVPAAVADEVGGARTVAVRQYTVVVNPFVTQLQAGQRIDVLTLDPNQVAGLLSGALSTWDAVGGPGIEIEPANLAEGDPGVYEPLPVRPIVFDPAAGALGPPAEVVPVSSDEISPNAVRVSTVEEFVNQIESNEGAMGVIRIPEALENGLTTLQVERVSHRLNLRPSTFIEPPSRAGEVGGLSYIIINTLVMILFVIAIAAPIGIAAAIYLVEYAHQGLLLRILRTGTDTLAGIPSIIFGLFGMVFFSQILGLKTGLLAGSFTLTIMILPTVIRTSEEALKSVPRSLREGSLALGATKLQTIFRVVLPAASPGILTGIILGIGRAVGETAALLFTMGSNLALVRSLNSPMRVLSIHLYLLIRENISIPNAFAAATILVVIVILVNYTTTRLIGRLNRMAGAGR